MHQKTNFLRKSSTRMTPIWVGKLCMLRDSRAQPPSFQNVRVSKISKFQISNLLAFHKFIFSSIPLRMSSLCLASSTPMESRKRKRIHEKPVTLDFSSLSPHSSSPRFLVLLQVL